MDLKMWIDVATAAGTVGAVIVALFGEDIRRLWDRPRPTAMIRPDGQDHAIDRFDDTVGYYLRFWVENQGTRRVEDVQIFVNSVSRKQANGSYRRLDNFFSMSLRWAHEASGSVEVLADISPGIGRQCNVGGVSRSNPAEFVLWTEAAPANRSHILSPGTYMLDIRIAAANTRPVPRKFELTFDGCWPDDAGRMSDAVGIREA